MAAPVAADLEIVLPGPNAGPAPRKAPVAPGKKTIKPLPKNPPDRVNLPPGFNTGLRQVGVARRGSVPVLPSVGEAPLTGAPSVAPPGGQIPVNGRLGRTLSTTVNIFRMPDPQSQWVGTLSKGQQVAIVSQWQGWWAIVMGDGSQAYVPQSHVEVLPYQVRSITAASPAPAPQPAAPGAGAVPGGLRTAAYSGPAKALLDEAYRYMGTPYVYGGNSESGIDCSGLVRNCFSSLGVQLPRRASEQARVGAEVPLSELQA
ncbi:MAG: Cell wall-associated hydrolase (invasion-associated protein), partial [Armatimonadetes bacterium]|nr:Cell wall-associated hydrolase (invasion-associated protein) [Armatimonadota bacterium]